MSGAAGSLPALLAIVTVILALASCRTAPPDESAPADEKISAAEETKPQRLLRGYIDKTGSFVIAPQFITASPFSEGLAHVCDPRGSYIDKTGKFVIKEPYYVGGDFHEGLAWVGVPKGKWSDVNQPGDRLLYGFIDKTGKFVIPPRYRLANDFSEGLALAMPESTQLMGFVDKQGKIVIKAHYTMNLESNDNELPVFKHGAAFVITEDNGSFYIDRKGKPLSRKEIERVKLEESLDEEGFRREDRNGLHGFLDRQGKVLIPFRYDKTMPFQDGMARVRIEGTKWGFIDKTGKIRLEPNDKYEYGNFKEGLCQFREQHDYEGKDYSKAENWPHATAEEIRGIKVGYPHGDWGFVDKTGKIVIEPKFPGVEEFSEGLACVEYPVPEEEAKKIKVPFEYIVENNSLIFPIKFSDEDDEKGNKTRN